MSYYNLYIRGFKNTNDFGKHIQFAAACLNSENCDIAAYPVFHFSFLLIRNLLPGLSEILIVWITTSVFQLASSVIIYNILVKTGSVNYSWAQLVLRALLSISLIVVGPISFLTWSENVYYITYISANSFHNPTIIALKPFALLSAWYLGSLLSDCFRSGYKKESRLTLKACCSTIVSALAKPSYAICILPVLLLYSGKLLVQKHKIKCVRSVLVCAFFLAFVLVSQTVLLFSPDQVSGKESGITLAPFEVMNYYIVKFSSTDNPSRELFIRLLMSVAFPLSVTLIFRKSVFRSFFFEITFLVFLFGAFYSYFFAEIGWRKYHGNFTWSGEIGLFLWFSAASIKLVEQTYAAFTLKSWRLNARYYFCWMVFFLHLVCGIAYLNIGSVK